MNAPRQGLFASLLIVSFALHTFLLVIATTHQLNENRASQGQLMTSQLVADSLAELEPANTVSLALVANRYATNPSVASIRILDANKQVLATSGMAKTRQGEVFVRDALQNEKKVGTVEITLIQPSIGEILRTQWLAIFASLFLHFLIWLPYRVIARPTRSEYLTRINQENHLKHEIQRLTQALALEKQNAITLVAQAQQQAKTQNKTPAEKKPRESTQLDDHSLALNIQFYDPKQLLNSVNQSVSVPYFKLCQLFLDKSIDLSTKHYQIDSTQIHVVQEFSAEGATLSTTSEQPEALECLMMIGAVFQLLSDVLYKRYREDKRFALQTRGAVASAVDAMQLDAVEAAKRLTQHIHAKEAALHLNHEQLKTIQNHYELVAMPNPSNIMTRHAFMINGMNEECATVAQTLRTEILMGKKAKAATES
ncbi:hypothetical protein L313_1025 [Acinetobacter haemolyticus CIP 64.3 = MTCC 9819]|uniref:DUF4175 domain-containing protein n=1 Tax=Acinetobacter haemolyticus CIP 64.3 = MTCC 9819 TaxID=1217659 RepID=N9GTM2_ACIHA|nr:hypothetical protein [Acinetobacter haemolyticus]ENW20409.1 hypothetical protein F927_00893 [Acinetobacter haemolyticus CIP 64.3 = MTCC 9819]EPR89682.1 hypothetical protein L313_1025 [Acinetobacter haemolyticus CIP 64.3 = MTCC 9819]QXZ27645.1 hypothetical protein I6L22_05045 [Acinetobacter haemolyticus]SPT45943.1 Uncharacterised protein [Acinetobacter haemolyticus]SUU53974.1 Uncharacterised protein [Acinetobacter haemolyticus]